MAKKPASTFTKAAATRVVRVVREIERGNRDIYAVPLRTGWDDGDPIQIGRTTAEWQKGTTQELEIIYAETCEDEGEPTTLEAWNLSFKVAANRLVTIALAANGCWYMVGAESCGEEAPGCPCPAIGGQDLTGLPNYDSTKTQFLAHASGCLKWVDVYVCPPVE